jgi:hypothetical protein
VNTAPVEDAREEVLNLASIELPTFSARVSLADGVIAVELSGNADVKAQDVLETFLSALHAEAARLRVSVAELDCRQLQFMNSCCLKALVSWIGAVQDGPLEQQYQILFLSSPRLAWQKRSFRALSCFAPQLVVVQQ